MMKDGFTIRVLKKKREALKMELITVDKSIKELKAVIANQREASTWV